MIPKDSFFMQQPIYNIMIKPKKLSINTSKSRGQLKLLKLLCDKNGWKEVFAQGDLLWSGLAVPAEEIGFATQLRVNRIPEMTHLCHKKTSGYILNKFYEYWPQHFQFITPTCLLPEHNQKLETLLKRKKGFYIAKPSDGSQGDGIILMTAMKDLPQYSTKQFIVQPYIDNPLLLDQKKFDLRLYVLVARVEPFIVLLNSQGLVRICTEDYQKPSKENIKNPYIHLTNYSLNKDNPKYVNSTEVDGRGNKRILKTIWNQLSQRGIDADALWQNIKQVVRGHMLALHPFIKYYYNSTFQKKKGKCFHLIGIDILIDQDLRPYVLELNANPSLKIEHEMYNPVGGVTKIQESPVDLHVKWGAVGDAIKFVTLKKAEQANFQVGSHFQSYQTLINGQEGQFNLLSRLVFIFHHLTGSKAKQALNSSQFCKLGRWQGLTNQTVLKSDFHLYFIKVMRTKFNPNQMQFPDFIQACEFLGNSLFRKETTIENMTQLLEVMELNL